MLAAYSFLKLFDVLVDEFYLPSALFADKMVMVVQIARFVARHALFKIHSRGDTSFAKELERTINRHLTDRPVYFADEQEELFHRDMVFGIQESSEYLQSLGSDAQSFAFEIF